MKFLFNLIVFIIILGIILFVLRKKNNEGFKTHNPLFEKTILITGATGTIGFALAKRFTISKCKLILTGKNQNKINKLSQKLGSKNIEFQTYLLDLESKESIETFMETIKNRNIDIMVHCANYASKNKYLTSESFENLNKEMNVNITGTFYLMKKIINKMKFSKVPNKIFFLSSPSSRQTNSNLYNSANILSKSGIEKMASLLAMENYKYDIGIGIIRVDDGYYSSGIYNIPKTSNKSIKNMYKRVNSFTKMMSDDPDDLAKLLEKIIEKPLEKMNGKIYSTTHSNDELHEIVPNNVLALTNNYYKKYKLNEEPGKYQLYVNKQNPYKMSKAMKSFLKNYDYTKNRYNMKIKYPKKLAEALSKELGVFKDHIVFFKNEYNAIKKMLSIFVPKYDSIVSVFPLPETLEFVSNELKLDMKYTVFKAKNHTLQPKYTHIISQITPKTKLIYLTNPNNLSGICLNKKEFDDFLKKVPENIIVFIDETFIDFADKVEFNSLDYLKNNVIILRSFSNKCSYENLEICYALGSPKLIEIIEDSNVRYNQINNFNQELALICLKDKVYFEKVRELLKKERDYMFKKIDAHDLSRFDTHSNFFLFKGNRPKNEIVADCAKNDIIIENEEGFYNSYWSLPISNRKNNDRILEVLTHDF